MRPAPSADRFGGVRLDLGSDATAAPTVWLTTPAEVGDQRFQSAWRGLTPEERDRAGRFAFNRDIALFVTARGLLREAVAGLLGPTPDFVWRLSSGPDGRPFVSGRPDVDISISHTRGLVAVAVWRGGRCGVDVEAVPPQMPGFAAAVLTAAELATLTGADASAGFVTYWTLKESMSKAVGNGLGMEFDQVGFSDYRVPPCTLTEVLPGARLRGFSRRIGDWRFHHECALGGDGPAGVAVTWTRSTQRN